MAVWAQYEALTTLSHGAEAQGVLQKIISSESFLQVVVKCLDSNQFSLGLPNAFTTDEREKTILALLGDVLQCTNSKNGRLDKTSTRVGYAYGFPAP